MALERVTCSLRRTFLRHQEAVHSAGQRVKCRGGGAGYGFPRVRGGTEGAHTGGWRSRALVPSQGGSGSMRLSVQPLVGGDGWAQCGTFQHEGAWVPLSIRWKSCSDRGGCRSFNTPFSSPLRFRACPL